MKIYNYWLFLFWESNNIHGIAISVEIDVPNITDISR